MSYKRKDSDRYRIQFRQHGKRYSVTFPVRTKKETVDDYELKLRLEKINPSLRTGENPTFSAYATKWLEEVCKVEHSFSYYKCCEKDIRLHLTHEIGDQKLKHITNFHIAQMQRRLKEQDYAVQTIGNILSTASSVFKEAIYAGILGANPVTGIKRLKHQQKEIACWGVDERDRYLESVREENFRAFQISAFAACSGLRPMEQRGLCRDCVDFISGFITVRRQWCTKQNKLVDYTKTRRSRRVPVPREILNLIKAYENLPGETQIFPDYDNSYGIRVLKPLMIKAGVQVITPHGFRHTFASIFLRKGGNIMDLKELLGHTKLDSTIRYLHLVDQKDSNLTRCLVENVSWISDPKNDQGLGENLVPFKKSGTQVAPKPIFAHFRGKSKSHLTI